MNRPEQALQKAIIKLADLTRMPVDPRYWPSEIVKSKVGRFLHWTPNGNHLTPAQRGISKAMGLRPGIFDLCLRVPVSWRFRALGEGDVWLAHITRSPGYWFELKSKSGKASPAQLDFSDSVGLMDYAQRVIRSVEDWQAAIAGYFDNARPLNYDWSKDP